MNIAQKQTCQVRAHHQNSYHRNKRITKTEGELEKAPRRGWKACPIGVEDKKRKEKGNSVFSVNQEAWRWRESTESKCFPLKENATYDTNSLL